MWKGGDAVTFRVPGRPLWQCGLLLVLFLAPPLLATLWQPLRPRVRISWEVGELRRLLGVSPDGTFLVSVGKDRESHRSPGPLQLWDLNTGQLHCVMAHGWDDIKGAEFSPDGQYLVVHNYDVFDLWHVAT